MTTDCQLRPTEARFFTPLNEVLSRCSGLKTATISLLMFLLVAVLVAAQKGGVVQEIIGRLEMQGCDPSWPGYLLFLNIAVISTIMVVALVWPSMSSCAAWHWLAEASAPSRSLATRSGSLR